MRVRLYDWGLVRRLGRAAKLRAKQSGIKGLQKRWWSRTGIRGGNAFWKVWLSFILIRVMATRLEEPMGAGVVAGCACLGFAGIALQRAKSLRGALTNLFERVHSYFYPLSEKEFLERTQFQSAVSFWWLLVVAVVIFRLMQTGDSVEVWLITALAAIAEVFMVLCLSYALEPYVEAIPRWLPLGFFGMAGVWFYTPPKYEYGQQIWVNALPTGWVNVAVVSAWSMQARAGALAAGAIAFGAVAWFVAEWRRKTLLGEFDQFLNMEREIRAMEEEAKEEAPSEAWRVLEEPEEESEVEEVSEAVQNLPIQATWQKHRIGAIGTAWGEAVRQGGWLQRWDWEQMPWLERAMGWWLTEHEKDTLWFLTGAKPPAWSNGWKNSVIALAVGVLCVLALPGEWRLVGVLSLIVALGLGLPLAGGVWAATAPGWISGKVAPIHSIYPLRYGLASRAIAKVNLMRTLAWLPFAAVLAVVEAKLTHQTIGHTMWIAARVVLVWLAWVPIAIAGKFSKGTNDTAILGLAHIVVLPVLVLLVCGAVILWGVILVVDQPEVLLAAVAAIAGSVGIWAAYGWWYDRKVDLLRDRQ